jgi:hypothetical protein
MHSRCGATDLAPWQSISVVPIDGGNLVFREETFSLAKLWKTRYTLFLCKMSQGLLSVRTKEAAGFQRHLKEEVPS